MNEQTIKALAAIGAVAEWALQIYRAVINAGGTRAEASDIVEAHFRSLRNQKGNGEQTENGGESP